VKQAEASSNVELRFILDLFFEVIDSIRYSTNYYNPTYKHLERSIKVKTTQEINKIAELSAKYFYSNLIKNRKLYVNNPGKVDQLKRRSLERAISKVESE
jgi:hypothetical protein